jgi:prepilin-type N-terminal cleavage/methylation domain-containing protein
MNNNFKKAFSLIEISIVILVVGILIAGISKGVDLVYDMRLATARALTDKAPMFGMENLEMWLETTSENSLATGTASFTNVANPPDKKEIGRWNDLNPTLINPNNKNHAVQGTLGYQPLYIQDGINGLPALLFDGKSQADGGDYFDIINGKTNFIEFTIFIVAKPEFYKSLSGGSSTVMNISCSGSYSACAKTSSSNGYNNYNDSNPAGMIYFISPSSTNDGLINLRYYARIYSPPSTFSSKDYITPNFTNNTPIIASVNHGQINASVIVSPFNKSISLPTSPFLNDPNSYLDFRIGKQKDGFDRYFKGYLSEIILFGRSLNDQETLLIKNYLSEKWRIKL